MAASDARLQANALHPNRRPVRGLLHEPRPRRTASCSRRSGEYGSQDLARAGECRLQSRGPIYDVTAVVSVVGPLPEHRVPVVERPVPVRNLRDREHSDAELLEIIGDADFLFLDDYRYLITRPLLDAFPGRDDVYQLVDHARRRGLHPAITLSPTTNATPDAIARLRRNGLSRPIVSLEGAAADIHDASCGVPGSYRRTLHIIGTALVSGIDVEVNTLVTRYNIDVLDAIYERIERLGVVAWNVHLPVARPGVETLSTDEVSQVQTVIERLRGHGLADIRLTDPTVSTVFITSEGYVRNGEFVSGNSGNLRRSSLTQICRSH